MNLKVQQLGISISFIDTEMLLVSSFLMKR